MQLEYHRHFYGFRFLSFHIFFSSSHFFPHSLCSALPIVLSQSRLFHTEQSYTKDKDWKTNHKFNKLKKIRPTHRTPKTRWHTVFLNFKNSTPTFPTHRQKLFSSKAHANILLFSLNEKEKAKFHCTLLHLTSL